MEFTLTQDFPAGLDHLWSAFGRADYPRQKYLALGACAVRLRRLAATPQAIDVDLERDVPVDRSRLPAWARAVVGSQQTLRHRTAWRRTGPTQASAELEISPDGLPVHARGRATIVELGPQSTRLQLTWQVQSSVPMIGHRVEQLFAHELRSALDADHAFTLQYLKGLTASPERPRPRPADSPS